MSHQKNSMVKMISRKKLTILGTVISSVLIVSTVYFYLLAPSQSPHLALLSESQAEEISGQNYSQSFTTILQGNNLSYGEMIDETIQYSNPTGIFHVEVIKFNNHPSSQFIYSYLSSQLSLPSIIQLSLVQQPIGNTMVSSHVTSTNVTSSETYKGFNYTYLVLPVMINFNGKYHIWDGCGVNGNYVFYIWGKSPSPPHTNMSIAAKEQINLMSKKQ